VGILHLHLLDFASCHVNENDSSDYYQDQKPCKEDMGAKFNKAAFKCRPVSLAFLPVFSVSVHVDAFLSPRIEDDLPSKLLEETIAWPFLHFYFLTMEGRFKKLKSPQGQFMDAVALGQTERVAELLQAGDVDPSVDGDWALRFSINCNFPRIVEMVLRDERVRLEPWMLADAVKSGYAEIVEMLLPRVEQCDIYTYSYFYDIARKNYVDVAKVLLADERIAISHQILEMAMYDEKFDLLKVYLADKKTQMDKITSQHVGQVIRCNEQEISRILLDNDNLIKANVWKAHVVAKAYEYEYYDGVRLLLGYNFPRPSDIKIDFSFSRKYWEFFPTRKRETYVNFMVCLKRLRLLPYFRDLHDSILSHFIPIKI